MTLDSNIRSYYDAGDPQNASGGRTAQTAGPLVTPRSVEMTMTDSIATPCDTPTRPPGGTR